MGEDAEREVQGGVLLKLVSEGRTTLGHELEEAVRWYSGHGLSYPNLDDEELAHDLAFARTYTDRRL